MRTCDLLLRQVRRALTATFLLGGLAAVLQLALPLCALHVLDSAVPSRSVETLALLAAFAACAVVAFACVEAARTRILVRAGLWLDHTLGGHALQQGLARAAAGEEIEGDAAALARLRAACTDGTVRTLLDLPWLLVTAAVLLLLDWRLGAVAVVALLALAGARLLARRGLALSHERAAAAATRAQVWLQSIVRMSGLGRMPQTAAGQWERLSREHVANAFPLHLKAAALVDLARCLRLFGHIAILCLGAWLIMDSRTSAGTLLAALMLAGRIFEPLEGALASLSGAAGLRSAWQRLSRRATGDIGRPASPLAPADLPRLRYGGPLLTAGAAALLFFSIAIGATATTRIGTLAAATGSALFGAELADVLPRRDGVGAHVLVSEGATVSKGDVLVTLDTRRLDAHIASLKLQASTAQIELTSLNREIAQLIAPGAPPLKSRAPIERLEARIATLDAQGRHIKSQIEMAEHELAESRILAPVAGRVLSLRVKPGMPVERDVPLATLVTSDETVLERLLSPLAHSTLTHGIGSLARILGITPAQAREPNQGQP